jgi:hypothetical protein
MKAAKADNSSRTLPTTAPEQLAQIDVEHDCTDSTANVGDSVFRLQDSKSTGATLWKTSVQSREFTAATHALFNCAFLSLCPARLFLHSQ